MKLTFLGTGTSIGVPVIGCECAVCTSTDPRNRRRRTSIYVEAGGVGILVDTAPDFREQALAYRIRQIDAVLFTHSHADHVMGFDDIRVFNVIQDRVIPAYGHAVTMANVRRIFDYVDAEGEPGAYRPRIEFLDVHGPFMVGAVDVLPVSVEHWEKPTYGYVFTHAEVRIAYVPDCKAMSDEVVDALRGVDVMVLDGLRHREHRTHLTVAECIDLLQRIGAKQSYMIHMTHDLDHEETERELPDGIRLSYDGLTVEV